MNELVEIINTLNHIECNVNSVDDKYVLEKMKIVESLNSTSMIDDYLVSLNKIRKYINVNRHNAVIPQCEFLRDKIKNYHIGMVFQFNEIKISNNIDDFYIAKMENEIIEVRGGFNFLYYTDVILKFKGVEHVNCTSHLSFENMLVYDTRDKRFQYSNSYEDFYYVFEMYDEFSQVKNYIVACDLEIRWNK